MILTVATSVKPSLNIAGNGFVEMTGLDVINEGVGIHVAQPKVLTILGLHVLVIMKFVHDDLIQIKDGLPEVDRFAHYDTGLSHLASHQVLAEDNS